MAWTLSTRRLPTNTVPLSPSASERAFAMPEAYTSILKPAGTFSFAVGSLSAAAGIGGGAIGTSLAAASLSAGRPISGEPGGNGAAALGDGAGGGLAAGGLAGCWAAAASVNALKKAPASQRLCGANMSLLMDVIPGRKPYSPCRHDAAPSWLPP